MIALLVLLSANASSRITLPTSPSVVRFAGKGTLAARIVIVEELKSYPVAYTDFSVIGPDPGHIEAVRTDGDGVLNIDLRPGLYAFESKKPTTFNGRDYTWATSFEIEENRRTLLTLTHSDALIERLKTTPTETKSSPETRLYAKYQYSVATVECDAGSGSGFVIDAERGLMLTSYHIGGGSRFLSVRFNRGSHYEARLVSADPSADLAIIRVNPDVLRNAAAIPVSTIVRVGTEGERIVAMGSPAFQQTTITQGILSKVEEDALISDVTLSRGNSGGPILNLEGTAIGVATYGDASQPGAPGINGIVSTHRAEHLLRSIGNLPSSTLPPSDKLPDNSPVKIPPEMLERVALGIKGDEPYLKAPKNFRTYFKTPFDAHLNVARYKDVLQKKIARRYRGQIPADQKVEMGPLYFWNKYVGSQFEPVVSIEVVPWPQETNNSVLGRIAASAFGQHQKEFRELRDDFTKVVLLRNGVEATPILRKRIRDTEIYDSRDVSIHDTALAGFYTYDPSVFNPGSRLELEVWKNGDTRPTVIRVPESYQKRIYSQFQEWYRLGG